MKRPAVLPSSVLTQVISVTSGPAATLDSPVARPITAKAYIFLIIVITVLMSPLPIPPGVASLDCWGIILEPHSHWSIVLLLSFFAAATYSIIVVLGKRKRSVSNSDQNMEGSNMGHEELPVRQRKDSPQNQELDLSMSKEQPPVVELKENKDDSEAQSYDIPRRISPGQNQNDHLESLKQETLEPSLLPIYPWIAPPQRLPGPYDAPYYPVPLPTIAIQETAGDGSSAQISKNEMTSSDRPEELETIVYSRRLPPMNASESEFVREGVVTVSTRGWRRTLWTVNAG